MESYIEGYRLSNSEALALRIHELEQALELSLRTMKSVRKVLTEEEGREMPILEWTIERTQATLLGE